MPHIRDFFPLIKGKKEDPRPGQIKAMDFVEHSFNEGYKYVLLEAPAGIGKSAVEMATVKSFMAHGKKSFWLTSQVQLQDQIKSEFTEGVDLRGRSRYACNHAMAKEGLMAHEGVCKDGKKSSLPECFPGIKNTYEAMKFSASPSCYLCPYYRQVALAVQSMLAVMNYDAFLKQMRVEGRFPPRHFMAVDEAHQLEDKVANDVALKLSEAKAKKHLPVEISFRGFKEFSEPEHIKEWVEKSGIKDRISDAIHKTKDIKAAEELTKLVGKIDDFINHISSAEWIVYEEKHRLNGSRVVKARPLFADAFVYEKVLSKAEKFLFCSATILDKDKWCRSVGLDPEKVAFLRLQSEFPLESRPIHVVPCFNFGQNQFRGAENDRNHPGRKAMRSTILAIVEGLHPLDRGIIHSHSEKMKKMIQDDVDSSRFVTKEAFGPSEMMNVHRAKPGSVLLSSSMREGVDLADNDARFAIIAKVPYPQLEKWERRRLAADPGWYAWKTAITFMQTCGRTVRNKDDWSKTYVIDDGFGKLHSDVMHMFPNWFPGWFEKSIVWHSSLDSLVSPSHIV